MEHPGLAEMLRSPQFWVAALVAGLFMSVLGAYAKQGLDGLLSLMSKGWRDWRAAQRQAWDRRIKLASEDAHFFDTLVLRETRAKFRMVFLLIGACTFWIVRLLGLVHGVELGDLWGRFFTVVLPVTFIMLFWVQLWYVITFIQREQFLALQARSAQIKPAEEKP